MDARRLRYFVTVAELGSFSAAARQLRVAQPALSRHVKTLEDELGIQLLARNARGVAMTNGGEELFRHARRVLKELEMLPQVVGRGARTVSGRVAIGLPTSTSAVLSKPILTAALERFPLVRMHLIESLSGFLLEWIESGRLDLAVLFDAQPTPFVHLDPILVEDLWLVGAASAFSGRPEELPFRSLPDYPLLLPSVSHSHRSLLEGMALRHGVHLNVLAAVDSLTVLKSIVADGQAFTIFAQSAVHAEIAAGTLHAVRVVDPTISRSVSLATSIARGQSRACDELAALTLEEARRLIKAGIWRGRLISSG